MLLVSAGRPLALAVLLSTFVLLGTSPALAAGLERETYLVSTPASSRSNTAAIAEQVRSAGGRVDEVMSNVGVLVAQLTPAAAEALSSRAGLLVERPQAAQLLDVQSSPPSYGLDRIDQRALPLSGSYTWPSTENGAGGNAYIVDTGVLRSHTEFTGRIATGFNATTDGLDANDCAAEGHGTHVAGTVGGRSVGVARGVTIVPVRVFVCDATGASWTDIIRGIDWIIGQHDAGEQSVANFSLGGAAYDTGDAAIQRLINDGVTVVVAAGNSNADACKSSPSRVAAAITVASSTVSDARASYSNWGTCVDIFAPGGDSSGYIYSSWATSTTAYARLQGTSMAAPHVAGAVSRYLQRHPTATPLQVAQALRSSATPGVVTSPGSGTPNFLLHSDPEGFATAPHPPTALAATAVAEEPGSATVSWTAPVDSPNHIPVDTRTAPVSAYRLVATGSDGSTVTVLPDGAQTTQTVTGLAPSLSWTFTLVAVNRVGSSSAATSNTLPATSTATTAPPTAPTALTASANGFGSLTYSWAAPENDGGSPITGYRAVIRDVAANSIVATLDRASSTFVATQSGLSAGRQYTVTLTATNAVGASPATTSASVTVASPATAPQSARVSYPATMQARVTWTAPTSLGFSPLVRYEIRWTSTSSTSSYGAWVSAGTNLSYTIVGIPKGAVRYLQVRAVTLAGPGTSTSSIKFTQKI